MEYPWDWWVWLLLGTLLAGIGTGWYFTFRGARGRARERRLKRRR